MLSGDTPTSTVTWYEIFKGMMGDQAGECLSISSFFSSVHSESKRHNQEPSKKEVMPSIYRRLQDGKIEPNLDVAFYYTWRRGSYYVNSDTLHCEIAV